MTLIRTEEEHLAHYGILRKSGRYPWGSGDTPGQRSKSFFDITKEQKDKGMSEKQIAESHGLSVKDYRETRNNAKDEKKLDEISTAQRHKDNGWGNSEIGRRMGLPESTVRTLLAPGAADKANLVRSTANMLKREVDSKKMLDIGIGVEKQIGVTEDHLSNAVHRLKDLGYTVHNLKILQLNTGNFTKMKVLALPGVTTAEARASRHEIRQIQEHSTDHGRSFVNVDPPISANSSRIRIRYAEDGGDKEDGLIYVRPGVDRLSLGSKNYAQVRIAVDGTHYLKGMAIYKDDLPPGVDLVFNTKLKNTGRKKDAMKPMKTDEKTGKIDQSSPFGAITRQVHDPKTGKVISVMNIIGDKEGAGEEGSWDTWNKALSSQMLSKQDPKLAKSQLDLTHERRQREYEEISSLTNTTVRRDLLIKFADATDSAAVHLQAAALPRQATRVLLPIPSMKPTEIYAPSFRDGERVALVRHPHGGTFEIPQLTVNNRNKDARRLIGIGDKVDAVGINHKVAEQLSGADFDGDSVLVIPNNKGSVKSTPLSKD